MIAPLNIGFYNNPFADFPVLNFCPYHSIRKKNFVSYLINFCRINYQAAKLFREINNYRDYNLKALIASGGRGTRLRPITHTQNKHLIPVANKPILYYAIEAAVAAGIKEIGIVHNADSQEVPKYVGDGSKWGVRITYIPQQVPGGLAQVVQLSEEFIAGDKFIFYLGDNMLIGGVK